MPDRRAILHSGLAAASISLLGRAAAQTITVIPMKTQNGYDVPFDVFDGMLKLASKSAPVIFTIGANWCIPCRMLDASMDDFVAELKNQHKNVFWLKTDVDDEKAFGALAFKREWQAYALPHSGLYYQGAVVPNSTFEGPKDLEDLRKWYGAVVPPASRTPMISFDP